MIKRIMELIRKAILKMLSYKEVSQVVEGNTYTISEDMEDSINLWKQMYKDEAPWLDKDKGVYSLGVSKQICQEMQSQVLSEMKSSITEPGQSVNKEQDESVVVDTEVEPKTRAEFLDKLYKGHLLKQLPDQIEKAMALGGVVIKPYVSNNNIYFDFNFQGEFYPITFDDDGNITDIAFIDQFVSGEIQYTKVERQTFANNIVVVENKAFKCKFNKEDDAEEQELGKEIPLTSVSKWAGIEPSATIENVDKPLYGYYKVALANNIDLDCPLGISIFSPATGMIERTDRQFSRLDWEYEGGQLAIDVDPTALNYTESYYGTTLKMDSVQDRLYRKLDLGTDNTYNAFSPQLRDENYLRGMNSYLAKIEGLVGLARGTLSDVQEDARTATEIKILKQRTYITTSRNQENIEKALLDCVYAANVLVSLYQLAPEGDYTTNTEWKDSILTDTDTELTQKVTLEQEGILSKAEVRAWYTGEDIETAKQCIKEIQKESADSMMNDLFTKKPETTLETDEDDAGNENE